MVFNLLLQLIIYKPNSFTSACQGTLTIPQTTTNSQRQLNLPDTQGHIKAAFSEAPRTDQSQLATLAGQCESQSLAFWSQAREKSAWSKLYPNLLEVCILGPNPFGVTHGNCLLVAVNDRCVYSQNW